MAKNKKPTLMELKKVVTNVLMDVSQLINYTKNIDTAFSGYLEYKGDTDDFRKWFKIEMEKINESRSTESGDGSGTAGNGKARKETSAKQNQKTQSGNPQAKESTRTSDKSS